MATAGKTLASIAAPAAPVQQQPQVQQKKQNPKEKARIESGLAEVRVESVRVDGLALMKIIKHAREAHVVNPAPSGTSNATVSFSPAVGQLLGIDSNGVLEVSNSFALPLGSLGGSSAPTAEGTPAGSTEEGRGVKAANKYTQQLLPRLADLNADASLVGFYTSSNNGQHLAMTGFVDALLNAQLSGGGIGSGTKVAPVARSSSAKAASAAAAAAPASQKEGSKSGKGIAIVYDVASAAQGNVGLKAFRLTQEFMEANRAGKFDTQSLIDHKLVPSNILEEVPVTIHSSALLSAFLSTLVTPSTALSSPFASSSAPTPSSLTSTVSLPPSRAPPLSPTQSFATLSLPSASPLGGPAPLSTPLTALLSSLETHQAHLSTLSFQSRQLARDRARVESTPAFIKRKAENEQRAKDGLAPLPATSEEAALVEPNRLETMCALAGVQGAANALSEATGAAIVRSYASRAGTASA